ncbi:heterokaryon incompatibility protein-domain-containing protein [Dendryphion nanum]|uniref:Heterokaryon incompatibility protein-domain-containing protein n=1 Tax=Dendryphion nanum TaxID=256645 RepID=A0A9P9I9U1_9PLEO|nr:heterokaryon incompatibility protein-domain-containing protein [Dendryphion nanum]
MLHHCPTQGNICIPPNTLSFCNNQPSFGIRLKMRLINSTTLKLEEFFGKNIPPYAILSHTWGNAEVSFADLSARQATTSSYEGHQKIGFTCAQARRAGLNYAWVDTCCIDKSSSSELSEAINSMFAWYKDSTCYYAYLSDVSIAEFEEQFSKSRWFTRGWTLQELLAPEEVIFYDRDWNELGTKSELADEISEITGIDKAAFYRHPDPYSVDPDDTDVRLNIFCVAKRMSWASRRETTRAEDMAYCLLGIFGINMSLLYGEGQERAFFRLQEEIIKRFDDDSILAWGFNNQAYDPLGIVPESITVLRGCSTGRALATSPKDFESCGELQHAAKPTSAFTMTNIGLQIQLPLVSVDDPDGSNDLDAPDNPSDGWRSWIGLLSCSAGTSSGFLGIFLCSFDIDSYLSMNLERVSINIDGYSCKTMVVGPRAAVRSTLRSITILRDYDNHAVRNAYYGFRQIIVNESQAFQGIGYHVSNGAAEFGDEYVWDPMAKVLTIEGERKSSDLLRFCFEAKWNKSNSGSTLFLCPNSKRAIIREGTSFSMQQSIDIQRYLQDSNLDNLANEICVKDSKDNPFEVVVEVNEKKKVYRWRIFEVYLTLSNSSPA